MQTTESTQTNIYQELDEWFGAKGFAIAQTGKLMPGRKWERVEGERTVTVVCAPRTRTKHYGDISRMKYIGHELGLEITTSLHTRLSMVPVTAISLGAFERFLLRKAGVHRFTEAPEVYNYLKINVHEDKWAKEFLDLKAVQQHITEVLLLRGEAAASSFSLQPGTVYFRMRRPLGEIAPERVSNVLSSLELLADIAESCTPPLKRAERTGIENMGRDNPVKLAVLLLFGLAGFLFLSTAVLIAVVILGLQDIFIFFVLGCLAIFSFFVWRFFRSRKT